MRKSNIATQLSGHEGEPRPDLHPVDVDRDMVALAVQGDGRWCLSANVNGKILSWRRATLLGAIRAARSTLCRQIKRDARTRTRLYELSAPFGPLTESDRRSVRREIDEAASATNRLRDLNVRLASMENHVLLGGDHA